MSVHLENRDLKSFWPRGGPCWDGLGKTSRGEVLLVEAKANAPELASTCGAGPQALALIQSSLADAAKFYDASSACQWPKQYYQYANRLAHLYLLRELNGIPAFLVFMYFVNDFATEGVESVGEWISQIEAVHTHLGINQSQLTPYVIDLFFDVTALNGINDIEKQHVVQQALGTLEKHRVYVAKYAENGSKRLCAGFPVELDAFDSEDALLQALKQ